MPQARRQKKSVAQKNETPLAKLFNSIDKPIPKTSKMATAKPETSTKTKNGTNPTKEEATDTSSPGTKIFKRPPLNLDNTAYTKLPKIPKLSKSNVPQKAVEQDSPLAVNNVEESTSRYAQPTKQYGAKGRDKRDRNFQQKSFQQDVSGTLGNLPPSSTDSRATETKYNTGNASHYSPPKQMLSQTQPSGDQSRYDNEPQQSNWSNNSFSKRPIGEDVNKNGEKVNVSHINQQVKNNQDWTRSNSELEQSKTELDSLKKSHSQEQLAKTSQQKNPSSHDKHPAPNASQTKSDDQVRQSPISQMDPRTSQDDSKNNGGQKSLGLQPDQQQLLALLTTGKQQQSPVAQLSKEQLAKLTPQERETAQEIQKTLTMILNHQKTAEKVNPVDSNKQQNSAESSEKQQLTHATTQEGQAQKSPMAHGRSRQRTPKYNQANLQKKSSQRRGSPRLKSYAPQATHQISPTNSWLKPPGPSGIPQERSPGPWLERQRSPMSQEGHRPRTPGAQFPIAQQRRPSMASPVKVPEMSPTQPRVQRPRSPVSEADHQPRTSRPWSPVAQQRRPSMASPVKVPEMSPTWPQTPRQQRSFSSDAFGRTSDRGMHEYHAQERGSPFSPRAKSEYEHKQHTRPAYTPNRNESLSYNDRGNQERRYSSQSPSSRSSYTPQSSLNHSHSPLLFHTRPPPLVGYPTYAQPSTSQQVFVQHYNTPPPQLFPMPINHSPIRHPPPSFNPPATGNSGNRFFKVPQIPQNMSMTRRQFNSNMRFNSPQQYNGPYNNNSKSQPWDSNWQSRGAQNAQRKRSRPNQDSHDAPENKQPKNAKKKKPQARNNPTKKSWTTDDCFLAINVEREYNKRFKNQSLIIKFPDLELNRAIVESFHPGIENVHFQQPSTPRFCFVTLKEGIDGDKVLSVLNGVKFGEGYLSAEYKKDRDEEITIGPDDINPLALYIGNLAQEITKEEMVNMFPNSKRIDIGYAKKMKYTRYAFVTFRNVRDSVESFKKNHNKQMYSKSLIVRFLRLHGTVGMPGQTKNIAPEDSAETVVFDNMDYLHSLQAAQAAAARAAAANKPPQKDAPNLPSTSSEKPAETQVKQEIKSENMPFITPFLPESEEIPCSMPVPLVDVKNKFERNGTEGFPSDNLFASTPKIERHGNSDDDVSLDAPPSSGETDFEILRRRLGRPFSFDDESTDCSTSLDSGFLLKSPKREGGIERPIFESEVDDVKPFVMPMKLEDDDDDSNKGPVVNEFIDDNSGDGMDGFNCGLTDFRRIKLISQNVYRTVNTRSDFYNDDSESSTTTNSEIYQKEGGSSVKIEATDEETASTSSFSSNDFSNLDRVVRDEPRENEREFLLDESSNPNELEEESPSDLIIDNNFCDEPSDPTGFDVQVSTNAMFEKEYNDTFMEPNGTRDFERNHSTIDDFDSARHANTIQNKRQNEVSTSDLEVEGDTQNNQSIEKDLDQETADQHGFGARDRDNDAIMNEEFCRAPPKPNGFQAENRNDAIKDNNLREAPDDDVKIKEEPEDSLNENGFPKAPVLPREIKGELEDDSILEDDGFDTPTDFAAIAARVLGNNAGKFLANVDDF